MRALLPHISCVVLLLVVLFGASCVGSPSGNTRTPRLNVPRMTLISSNDSFEVYYMEHNNKHIYVVDGHMEPPSIAVTR